MAGWPSADRAASATAGTETRQWNRRHRGGRDGRQRRDGRRGDGPLTKLSTVLSSTPTNVPLLKKNDAFCVSDKAGYMAWMHYVGPTPNDMQGNMELQFKITIWKPGS